MILSDCHCGACNNLRSIANYGTKISAFLVTGIATGTITSLMGGSHDVAITSGVVAFFALTSTILIKNLKDKNF